MYLLWKVKIISSICAVQKRIEVKESSCAGDNPWYWEGNIQAVLVNHLSMNGYRIVSTANTASHESGKDIEAVGADGKILWVSVKGWPEKSQNTQARHWFSQALFDIILYRNESKNVDLAVAFPDKFFHVFELDKECGVV